VDRIGLRVVRGGADAAAAEAIGPAPAPVAFQEECLRAFEASQVARGFSELTIATGRARHAAALPGANWPAPLSRSPPARLVVHRPGGCAHYKLGIEAVADVV
jgi:hypothetical protein